MTGEPGQNTGDSTTTIGYSDASDTTEPGDAVGVVADEIEPGTDTEEIFGVRARGRRTEKSGVAPVIVSGPTLAAVVASVTGGERLDLGTTGADGELETTAGGPVFALSDAGGSWRGQDAPAGYAWVYL